MTCLLAHLAQAGTTRRLPSPNQTRSEEFVLKNKQTWGARLQRTIRSDLIRASYAAKAERSERENALRAGTHPISVSVVGYANRASE